ncbi:MAG TPA: hypothetical protein VHJ20_21875 [Polyangia bacterium]|nr:hypothetical protein [Polyangia bacterium]
MISQRTLGIFLATAALVAGGGNQALAKRKPKPPVDDSAAWGESSSGSSGSSGTSSTPAPAEDKPWDKPAEKADKPAAETTTKSTEVESSRAEAAPPAAPPEVPPPVEAAPPPPTHKKKGEVVVEAGAPPEGIQKSNGNADSPEGITWHASGWDVTLYGYAALNVMQDSTQSFGAQTGNTIIQRRGTIRGNRLQAQASSRDSRLGFRLAAPQIGEVKSSVNIETDFNNTPPIEYTEANTVTNAGFRMRHYYMKVETPVVDIIAGQYHDLFGWGGKGFYPSTLAFIGITGEVYHRQPQIRLSKILNSGGGVELEIAGAALRPVQKAGGYPDLEAGLRLAFNGWTGARQQAYGQPGIGAAGIGVSGIYRHFEVAQFLEQPGDTVPADGYGVVANLFLPIIPAKNNKKRGNSLSVTGEFSIGTGISDMYNGDLTGGLLFPALPNPTGRDSAANAPPVYTPNIDSGIVTFDGDNRLRTCNWQGLVAGFQYYLPIMNGRVWISGVHAQAKSTNIVEITPLAGRGGVYDHAYYYDGSLFVAITDQIQMGVSFNRIDQTLGDGVKVQNYRTAFGAHMFF